MHHHTQIEYMSEAIVAIEMISKMKWKPLLMNITIALQPFAYVLGR